MDSIIPVESIIHEIGELMAHSKPLQNGDIIEGGTTPTTAAYCNGKQHPGHRAVKVKITAVGSMFGMASCITVPHFRIPSLA